MAAASGAESYAALWREPEGSIARGKVVLRPDVLELDGATEGGSLSRRRLPYAEITGVRIGRGRQERLNNRPTLVVERTSGAALALDVLGPGMLAELAELLAELTTERRDALDRVVVLVPLRKGSLDAARALVASGPPFDPDESGLVRHEVFFTDREVLFLFEGPGAGEVVQRLARDPATWRAATRWRRLLAGAPRLARSAYAWRAAAAAAHPKG
jgi:hypothetical protein